MIIMKFLKTLTSLTLVFALFTLHLEGRAIAFSKAYSQVPDSVEDNRRAPIEDDSDSRSSNQATVPAPAITPHPDSTGGEVIGTLDYRGDESMTTGSLSMNQLVVMLILLSGPTIGIGCFSQISGKIFAASSAIYLLMEIMNYSSYKKAVSSTEEMYAEVVDDQVVVAEQIAAFVAAESLELSAADAVAKRSGNTKILAMGVTAAAIASFVEYAITKVTYGSCVAAATAAFTPFDPVCTKTTAIIEGCSISPCTHGVVALGDEGRAACAAAAAPLPVLNQPYGPQTLEDSQKYALIDLHNFVTNPKSLDDSTPAKKASIAQRFSQINELLNPLFINSLYAADDAKKGESTAAKGGILSGLGIPSAILGGILAWYVLSKTSLITRMASGLIRGLYFTLLAAFAWKAVGELDGAEGTLRARAKVYKALYTRLGALDSTDRFGNMGGIDNAIRNRIGQFAGIRDNANQPRDGALCLVGNLGEQRVDEGCNCRQNNSCSKVDFSSVGFDQQGLPGFFGDATSGLQSGANSLFSGNLSGANGSFAGVSRNAANLRKLNDRIKNQSKALASTKNNKLDKNRAKALDKFENSLEGEVKGIAKSTVKRALSSSKGSALSSLGIGGGGIRSATTGDPKDLKPKDFVASVQAAAAPVSAQQGASPLDGFKFDFPDDSSGTGSTDFPNMADGVLNQGDALADFENNESDISDRKEENIFNIITMRYFKSAFPRFFNEEGSDSNSLE